MDKEAISLNDITDLFRRRWPATVAVFLVVVMLAVVIAYTLDDLYASTGLIDIEKADPTADPETYRDRELRIYRINDDVMTRDKLTPLVEKHNLYPEVRGSQPPQSVVWLLRKNIQLQVIRKESEANSREVGPVVGFSVKFFHPDPQTAKAVARDLQDMFIEENNSRSERAVHAQLSVLESEREETGARLAASDQALVDFKKRNPGAMPDDLKRIQQQIDKRTDELVRVETSIRGLESDMAVVRTQLAQTPPYSPTGPGGASAAEQLQKLQADYLRLISLYDADHPDVRRVRRELEGMMGAGSSFAMRSILEAKLAEEQRNLADLKGRTAPDHPDRRNLERQIELLREQIASLPQDEQQAAEPTNPAYLGLQVQLSATGRELQAQRARRAGIQAELGDLEGKLDLAPEVERELVMLLREHDTIEKKYEVVLGQIEGTGRELARIRVDGVGEYWEIKKLPSLPYFPDYPNRPLYIILGVFLGLTLGIGAALVAETLDGTIRGTRDVRYVMQMPPIAAIPVIMTATDLRRQRTRRIAMTACVLAAVGAVGIYVRLQMQGVI